MDVQAMVGDSSSLVRSLEKFDVFISFRGEDTRRNFTSHFYDALSKKVLTFIDETELEKGDEISSTLIKAIEEAYVSVVIFSKDYASSKWCLNELVKILECKKDQGQIVIPVFYEVDPSHVRNQRGSYGEAFAKHEQDFKHNKKLLQKWKNALVEAANLAGWHSQNYRIESNFVKDIIEDILKKLNRRHPFEVIKKLVGIEKKYQETQLLLKTESNDVKTLGLWGMGGIGKTTLAKDLYTKLCPQFERHCFLKNVREESTRCGLDVVRNTLFCTLLELRLDAPYVETPIFMRKLACEKCFIVLDDVATLEQAENLNIGNNCLGPGSRVIVTTRDKQICSQFNECAIYEVKRLNVQESLQLFCLEAFREIYPKVGYEDLSKRTIGYCGGNPLTLKVLGANFRTKSKEAWESELEKLKKIPNERIHDVLKLSFDDLDCTQKDIFLDIACLFNPTFIICDFDLGHKDYLTVLFNACNYFAISGLEVLLHKALINITRFDDIEIHDLLVEMGREIVKQESPKDPGRRSRLWDPEEVYDVLKYNKGTEFVEAIQFDISEIGDVYLSSDSFKTMTNLRHLHINNNREKCYSVHLLDGLEWLSYKLRHLYWESFPLKSLPSTFCAERLVQLSMTGSKLRKLWDGIQKLDNLMIINLAFSKDLIEIPDLSRAPNLELVSFSHCESLCQLHPSIFTSPKLRELCLQRCKKIESVKANIHSKSFQILDLSGCSSLVEFSVTSEEMTQLWLGGTAILEFPPSIWGNSKLTYLDLSESKKFNTVGKKLSNDSGILGSLTVLYLTECTQINTLNLWFILDGMRSLKELDLRECCNLENLPDNIQNNSMLERLNIYECKKLKSLPKLPASLQQLDAANCTYLDNNSIHRTILENMFHRLRNNYSTNMRNYSFLPGAKVPCNFVFQTTEASIVIPPISKFGLCCFIFCIIISKDVDISGDEILCTIYDHTKEIDKCRVTYMSGELISDHILLSYWYSKKAGSESGSDHYNLSFEFKAIHYVDGDDEEHLSTKGIKGCGVFPVYYLDGRSSSGVEIVELQSSPRVSNESDQHSNFDIDDELQHQSSKDENEDDQQQLQIPPDEKEEDLDDKSFCDCSIAEFSSTMIPNWLELPVDITTNILEKLDTITIVTSVCLVCPLWRNICKDPLMWRTIRMTDHYFFARLDATQSMKICHDAIKRSYGHLEYVHIEHFATDDLLECITKNASNLRSLRLTNCRRISEKGFCEALRKLPQLEVLDITQSYLWKDSLEVVGRSCPLLKALKVVRIGLEYTTYEVNDDEAFVIAETMPGLHHLNITGNRLSNVGLLAILDSCSILESLDIRSCSFLDLNESLKKRCTEQIKYLSLPTGYNYIDYCSGVGDDSYWDSLLDDDYYFPY